MIKKIFFELLYWTWCLPQTLLGLIVYGLVKLFDKDVEERVIEKTLTHVIESEKFGGGISLGRYILIYDYKIYIGYLINGDKLIDKNNDLEYFLIGQK